MNTAQEILNTVRNLPLENQRELLEILQNEVTKTKDAPISEYDYADADDDFEPLEIEGKPLSETIIEERR